MNHVSTTTPYEKEKKRKERKKEKRIYRVCVYGGSIAPVVHVSHVTRAVFSQKRKSKWKN
jgi:hypothetical protein